MSRSNWGIDTNKVFNNKTILASANDDSIVIDLNTWKAQGFFSLDITIAGTGTAKFTYKLSNQPNGANAITPASASDISTAVTAGHTIVDFNPMVSNFLVINCEETGGANSVVVNAYLGCQ